MLNEVFLKRYPILRGTSRSSLYVTRQSHMPLRLCQCSGAGWEYWIMRNAQVLQSTPCENFKNYILANLREFLTGEKALYYITRVDLFPDQVVVTLWCDEVERLEVSSAVADKRLAALRMARGLPEDESEDEDEEEMIDLWYDASHENDDEYAARLGGLFPELKDHLDEIDSEVEVRLTGDVLLNLEEMISVEVINDYAIHMLRGNGLNLKVTRGNGRSRYTLFEGDFDWGNVHNDVMVGKIHKDYFEIQNAMTLS